MSTKVYPVCFRVLILAVGGFLAAGSSVAQKIRRYHAKRDRVIRRLHSSNPAVVSRAVVKLSKMRYSKGGSPGLEDALAYSSESNTEEKRGPNRIALLSRWRTLTPQARRLVASTLRNSATFLKECILVWRKKLRCGYEWGYRPPATFPRFLALAMEDRALPMETQFWAARIAFRMDLKRGWKLVRGLRALWKEEILEFSHLKRGDPESTSRAVVSASEPPESPDGVPRLQYYLETDDRLRRRLTYRANKLTNKALRAMATVVNRLTPKSLRNQFSAFWLVVLNRAALAKMHERAAKRYLASDGIDAYGMKLIALKKTLPRPVRLRAVLQMADAANGKLPDSFLQAALGKGIVPLSMEANYILTKVAAKDRASMLERAMKLSNHCGATARLHDTLWKNHALFIQKLSPKFRTLLKWFDLLKRFDKLVATNGGEAYTAYLQLTKKIAEAKECVRRYTGRDPQIALGCVARAKRLAEKLGTVTPALRLKLGGTMKKLRAIAKQTRALKATFAKDYSYYRLVERCTFTLPTGLILSVLEKEAASSR